LLSFDAPALTYSQLGWVQTKMGGPGTNDDLDQAHRTQVWLAASDDPASQVSGKYFYHLRADEPLAAALDGSLQDRFRRCL